MDDADAEGMVVDPPPLEESEGELEESLPDVESDEEEEGSSREAALTNAASMSSMSAMQLVGNSEMSSLSVVSSRPTRAREMM